ncbi:Eukaryotic translation initiation factor 3 subunit L, partial [Kickxella alabastrina]
MSGSSDNEQQSTSRVAKPQKRKTTAEIRDINKEKERVQREGSDETLQAAHQYLNQWVQDRGSWKFNKAKQLWLLRHIYSDTKIPTTLFPSALQYFAAAGDGLKKTMVDNARLVCHPMSANTDELRALRNKIIG